METAINASVLEEHLPRIQRAFQKRGFARAGELADRHGALQLTFAKQSEGLARLVLLHEAVGTGEDDYRGSVDVVVQAGDRFLRRRVISADSRDAFELEITGDAIGAAVSLADSFKDEDLSNHLHCGKSIRPLQTMRSRQLHWRRSSSIRSTKGSMRS